MQKQLAGRRASAPTLRCIADLQRIGCALPGLRGNDRTHTRAADMAGHCAARRDGVAAGLGLARWQQVTVGGFPMHTRSDLQSWVRRGP